MAATTMSREMGMMHWLEQAEAGGRAGLGIVDWQADRIGAVERPPTKELPRKLLPARAKEPQRRRREKR